MKIQLAPDVVQKVADDFNKIAMTTLLRYNDITTLLYLEHGLAEIAAFYLGEQTQIMSSAQNLEQGIDDIKKTFGKTLDDYCERLRKEVAQGTKR